MTVEAAARVDGMVKALVGNKSVDEAATAFLSQARAGLFQATDLEYGNFGYGGNELVQAGYFSHVYDALGQASGVDADKLQFTYQGILSRYGDAVRGESGRDVLTLVGASATAGVAAAVVPGMEWDVLVRPSNAPMRWPMW